MTDVRYAPAQPLSSRERQGYGAKMHIRVLGPVEVVSGGVDVRKGVQHVVGGSWPLVGRDEELILCDEVMLDASAGVVIAGAAGVGKTRLAAEVLDAAVRADSHVVRIAATQVASSIPFGAVAQLLPDDIPGSAASIDLLRAVRRAMVESAQNRRLVVGVDDAHLLDAASATLVHQLAASREASLVVTVRTGEPHPDAVVALWKDEGCAYLELQPLSEVELATLLELAIGPADGPTVHALWEVTRGAPLFVRELVVDGLERGMLTARHGIWHWRGPLAPGQRLRDLIELRLGDLPASERELLEAVALGEPLGRSFFAGAGERAADALIRRGLVEAVEDRRRISLRVAHPLYAEAARAAIPSPRAGSVRRAIADALEETGARRRDDALRVTLWRLEYGGAADAGLLLRAARQAAATFDPVRAEQLARAAVDAGAGAMALCLLGSALTAQGRFAEADLLLAEAETESRTDAELAAAAVARARNLMAGLQRPEQAAAILEAVESRVTDRAARRDLLAARGYVEFRLGRVADAARTFRLVLDDADADVPTHVYAAGGVAFASALAGRPAEGLEVLERWNEQAAALAGTPWSRPAPGGPVSSYLSGRALGFAIGGQLREAEEVGAGYYETAVGASEPGEAGLAATTVGLIMLLAGRVRTALRWLREASVLLEEQDPTAARPWPLAFAAQAAAQAGEIEEARSALAAVEASGWRAPLQEPSILLGQGWLAATEGAFTEARDLAAEAGELAERLGQLAPAMMAFHDLARLGDPERSAEPLANLTERTDGLLLRAFANHALACRARDAYELERCAATFRDLGAMLYAAEADAAAATAFSAAGRTASSRAASARSTAAQSRCEGAATPSLAGTGAVDLTRREREVAALAATGLSSAEIAARLVLSIRTIDNHLNHVYRKLGVTSRKELSEIVL
jgi:DNA-binding CsgD family transcriptional regulator